MTVSIEVRGGEELNRALARISDEVRAEVQKELIYTGQEMRKEIVKKYNRGPATGAFRADGSRASRPGEYPMTDTGALARRTLFARLKGSTIGVEVYNDTAYAAYLEFGTRASGGVGRPAFRDTIDEMTPGMMRRIEDAVRRGIT